MHKFSSTNYKVRYEPVRVVLLFFFLLSRNVQILNQTSKACMLVDFVPSSIQFANQFYIMFVSILN